MLVQNEFLRLEQLSGRAFTVDCFSRDDGSNSHCKQYYSPCSSFFSKDLAGPALLGSIHLLTTSEKHLSIIMHARNSILKASVLVFCLPVVSSKNPCDSVSSSQGYGRFCIPIGWVVDSSLGQTQMMRPKGIYCLALGIVLQFTMTLSENKKATSN
jgi:hypothetical protein